MLEQSLTQLGGVDYLVRQGTENPKSYMALLARAMPMQVQGSGNNGEIVIRLSSDDQGLL